MLMALKRATSSPKYSFARDMHVTNVHKPVTRQFEVQSPLADNGTC